MSIGEIQMREASAGLQRREFLRDSAVAAGAVLLCSCSPPSSRRSEGSGETEDEYYTSRRTELLEGFGELQAHTREVLLASC